MKRSITQRWMFNSLGLTVIVVVIIELVLVFAVRMYYYNMVQTKLVTTIYEQQRISGTLSNATTSQDFLFEAQKLVESFRYKDSMEFLVIANDRQMRSSRGFSPSEESMPDYEAALGTTLDGVPHHQISIHKLSNGENIMACTLMIVGTTSAGESVERGAIRLVVSLAKADQQVLEIMLILLAGGIAVVFFVIVSSLYLINSIVIPVRDLGTVARRIAMGDFDVRVEKVNNDEIGELCDTINQMAEELDSAERVKNDFISSVSHELRTPLTAIKGWGETLMSMDGESGDKETIQKGLRVIVGETERLSGIVEELLDFSRMQSGRMDMLLERIDLLAELGEAVVMYDELARREEIQFIYHEPEMLPAVLGDKSRLRQVFVNILDNAFKYSSSGSKVRAEAYETEEDVRVVISDNGPGIAAEDLPRVKERFFKAQNARGGSGIGLAVADEIVRMHGGLLELRSVEGVGTDAIIILPRADTLSISEETVGE